VRTRTLLDETIASIHPADEEAALATRRALDAKTKPRGSLGVLEDLAARIGAIRGRVPDAVPTPAVVVAAADHGVSAEGVSAYPREVTGQMLSNFAGGGAAVAVLARQAGARLVVVDAGVDGGEPEPAPNGVRRLALGGPSANIAQGPAMSRRRATAAIEAGIELVDELGREGVDVIAIGEMGIGNTTAAAAVCAALLGVAPGAVCGRGTGVDDAGLRRKLDAVARALAVNDVDASDPLGALAALGGPEIALLTGAILGCAARRVPAVLDGAVVGAAALVASRVAPACVDAMIAGTRSPEPAHTLVLLELGLSPLLDLGLRLGEGSGAALALQIVRASIAILLEMATFEDAGVSDAGA